jgi:heptosyltransferase-2
MTRTRRMDAYSADHPQRILIVGPAWIGDMVMAQSLFKALHSERPRVQIDVLAPVWCASLLRRMPEVREAINMPLGHGQLGLRARYRLGRELTRRGYAQAIILPRSFKSALVPWFARVPQRTGYRGEMRFGVINDMRPLDKAVLPQMVQRYVALSVDAGASLPPRDIPKPVLAVHPDNAARLMAQLNLSDKKPVVGLMPGAEYGPSKQWPLEYYAALVKRLGTNDLQVWVFGSHKEHAAGEQIVAEAGCGTNLCGKTQLEDAIDLIAQAKVAVSNDSGLMHVAAAVGVPVVALFGASTPAYTPPLSDQAEVVYLGIECSPCFDRTCRYGHYRCLRDIPVAMVFAKVCSQLQALPIKNSGLG